MLSRLPNGHSFNFPQLSPQIPAWQMIFVQPYAFALSHPLNKSHSHRNTFSCSYASTDNLGAPGVSRFSEGNTWKTVWSPDTPTVRLYSSDFSNKTFKIYGMILVLCIQQLISNQSKDFWLMGFLFFTSLLFLNTKSINISHNCLFFSF